MASETITDGVSLFRILRDSLRPIHRRAAPAPRHPRRPRRPSATGAVCARISLTNRATFGLCAGVDDIVIAQVKAVVESLAGHGALCRGLNHAGKPRSRSGAMRFSCRGDPLSHPVLDDLRKGELIDISRGCSRVLSSSDAFYEDVRQHIGFQSSGPLRP